MNENKIKATFVLTLIHYYISNNPEMKNSLDLKESFYLFVFYLVLLIFTYLLEFLSIH